MERREKEKRDKETNIKTFLSIVLKVNKKKEKEEWKIKGFRANPLTHQDQCQQIHTIHCLHHPTVPQLEDS